MEVNNPRKPAGGKLEVKLCMKQPLLKPQWMKRTHQWMTVQFGTTVVASPQASISVQNNSSEASQGKSLNSLPTAQKSAELVPALDNTNLVPALDKQKSAQKISIAAEGKQKSDVKLDKPTHTDSKEMAVDKNSPVKPTVEKAKSSEKVENVQTKEDEDVETLEVNFLAPDNIVSNQVLETEHQQLLAEIASYPKSSVPEELLERRQAYEFKMNMLVTLIQVGSLDMPGYCKMVNASIEEMKKAALVFKKAGKLDLAKQALVRVKLMTAEMADVQ